MNPFAERYLELLKAGDLRSCTEEHCEYIRDGFFERSLANHRHLGNIKLSFLYKTFGVQHLDLLNVFCNGWDYSEKTRYAKQLFQQACIPLNKNLEDYL